MEVWKKLTFQNLTGILENSSFETVISGKLKILRRNTTFFYFMKLNVPRVRSTVLSRAKKNWKNDFRSSWKSTFTRLIREENIFSISQYHFMMACELWWIMRSKIENFLFVFSSEERCCSCIGWIMKFGLSGCCINISVCTRN